MNRQKVWFEAEARNFETTATGVRWEAVIFSSEFNRNKAYFDVNKLQRWANKLNKILLNDDHDGKYFSITTDKITAIKVQTDEQGVTEVFAVVESTNPEKVTDPTIVTGFSIELMVNAKDVIANENGEYYIDFEWIGMAYLRGQLAGSGDTRLLSMRTFAQAQNNKTMTEDQIKAMLAEQADQLKQTFKAETDELKADFTAQVGDIVDKYKSQSISTSNYTDEEGNKYETNSISIWESITTLIEKGEMTGALYDLLKAKKLEVKPFSATSEGEGKNTDTDEKQDEEENELQKIEHSLKHAKNFKKQMSKLGIEEELSDHQSESKKTADSTKTKVSLFLAKFRK